MSANDSAQPMELSEKGKGKQVEQGDSAEMSMDDESSGEESGVEEVPEEADEDNMEEIDETNIVGSRTRGKNIDWQVADQKSKEAGDMDEDDDEEDDDFVDPDESMRD